MTRTTADVTFLRGYNQALVMAVGRTVRTFERATVVTATGLTPQAVSKVIARLIADGLIRTAGVRRPTIGKPAVVYELVPDSRYAIGAHVARRTLRLVLVDLAGTVHHSAVRPLPADFTPEQLLHALKSGIDAITDSTDVRGRLTGVGLGMIGPLDHEHGVVRDAHGLRHWHDVPLKEIAEAHLGLPVHLDKDVTAGITAEAWRHGGTFGDAALIMVESGIGGGFWLGGTAHRGSHTNAGEFGHTVVQLDGPSASADATAAWRSSTTRPPMPETPPEPPTSWPSASSICCRPWTSPTSSSPVRTCYGTRTSTSPRSRRPSTRTRDARSGSPRTSPCPASGRT
ncbi:hypothetical protein GCM10027614_18540 [Micromonospora vulcania]